MSNGTTLPQSEKLNICFATAELTPLAKSGGLADVSAALAAYLNDAGHDIRVIMPLHSQIENLGLAIEPVPGLQNLHLSLGSTDLEYAVDRVIVPATGLPVYLLRCPELYDRSALYTSAEDEHQRFAFLSRAVLDVCQHMKFSPDIVHCNDWHTGLIPLYLRSTYSWDKLFAGTRSLMTIHNIGYQGVFDARILNDLNLGDSSYLLHQEDLQGGHINLLKTGLLFADALTTVSPTYAREIQNPEYGMGLDSILRDRADVLTGILNGVDYDEWNPATDESLSQTFSADDLSGKAVCKRNLKGALGLAGGADQPLIGIVTRLVEQKGVDLMERVIPDLLTKRDFSLAVLGSGEPRFESFFQSLHTLYPDRVNFHCGYSEKLAHRIEAGSDMFLMPSAYEPCGLNQMYSLKYGTVPIVRETGGLADSVQPINPERRSGTGILFKDYDETGLIWAINTALDLFANPELWRQIMLNGMAEDFSWTTQGAKYLHLYRELLDSA